MPVSVNFPPPLKLRWQVLHDFPVCFAYLGLADDLEHGIKKNTANGINQIKITFALPLILRFMI